MADEEHDTTTATTTKAALIASSIPITFPMRDSTHLFASLDTIKCAKMKHCIPCGYKIGLFDVALDKEFCQQVPNQRPEQCPRLVASSSSTRQAKQGDPMTTSTSTPPTPTPSASSSSSSSSTMGYQPGMSVLTVGDGDFSFSLAVARILFRATPEGPTVHKPSSLIATSYETEETLRGVYPDFDETLEELQALGATTRFQVDATNLQQSLPAKTRKAVSPFHRICWNFPCTAIAKGQDGQNEAMEENKGLVRRFVANAVPLLTSEGDGEIHICHKTRPPFNQWKLEEAALESLVSSKDGDDDDASCPLTFAGRVVLDRALLPPYTPRKALDRKSFPCHDACFYIFVNEVASSDIISKGKKKKKKKAFPPSLRLPSESDTPPTGGEKKDSTATPAAAGATAAAAAAPSIVPLTPAVIQSIRSSFIRQNKIAKAKRASRGPFHKGDSSKRRRKY